MRWLIALFLCVRLCGIASADDMTLLGVGNQKAVAAGTTPTLTYCGGGVFTGNGTTLTQTITSVPFCNPALFATRRIILAVGGNTFGVPPTAVTIGGNVATSHVN